MCKVWVEIERNPYWHVVSAQATQIVRLCNLNSFHFTCWFRMTDIDKSWYQYLVSDISKIIFVVLDSFLPSRKNFPSKKIHFSSGKRTHFAELSMKGGGYPLPVNIINFSLTDKCSKWLKHEKRIGQNDYFLLLTLHPRTPLPFPVPTPTLCILNGQWGKPWISHIVQDWFHNL